MLNKLKNYTHVFNKKLRSDFGTESCQLDQSEVVNLIKT